VIGAGGSGSVTIAIGTAQTASGSSGTVTAGLKADGTSLTYTPASTYTGTITVSAKLITPISTFSYVGKDSTGATSFQALYQTLGSLNNSFQGGGGTYNTIGSYNSAQGYRALYSNTTGTNNSAQGYDALYSNTTGGNNSAQGVQAGYTTTSTNANTTGSYNTWIGYNSGPGVVSSSSLQNATAIGNGALNMASNQVVLGNASVTDVYLGSATPYATLHDASETVYNPTASTGVTKVNIQDGAGQGTTPSLRVTNNAGTAFSMTARGAVGSGIILTDSAGACWNIVATVTTGVLTSTSVTCPTVP
jgi:hypothetical protein